MLIYFITIGLLISVLLKDYNSDKGKFNTNKAIHGIILVLLIFKFLVGFRQLGWVLRHSERFYELFHKQIGLLSPAVTLTHSIVIILAYSTGGILVVRMASRKDKARRQFLTLLPVFVFTESMDFYKGFVGEEGYVGNHYVPLAIGFVFAGVLCSIIHLIYRSVFMQKFFQQKEVNVE